MNLYIHKMQQKGEIYMKIIMENIGKIIDADIELSGLSVIAGYNNTGKSTILKAIYTGLNIFRNSDSKVLEERKKSINTIIYQSEDYFDKRGYEELPSYLLEELMGALDNSFNELSELDKEERFKAFKQMFLGIVNLYSDTIVNTKGGQLIYTDSFIKPLFEEINVIIERSKEDYIKFYGNTYIKNVFKGQLNNMSEMNSAYIYIRTKSRDNFIMIENNKIADMSNNFTSEPDAIYIPSCGLLDIIDGYGQLRKYSPEGDIRNYLFTKYEKNYTYEEYNAIKENTSKIAGIIEDTIHGELELSQAGRFYFKDKKLDKLVNLSNTASGMKKFLLIKRLIENGTLKKDSVLLIDEPETNLHPEWHLKLAEILVLLYKEMGIISVINSHSPYFIRAIEVTLADCGMKKNGRFYLMESDGENLYRTKDVTGETNLIYEELYEPLEYL